MSSPKLHPNIVLKVAYDGTNYLGWQKTNTGPSIEESLEIALAQILQEKVVLQAASRTDAGVHALGQVVNFIPSKELDLLKLQIGLNSLLSDDISILSISSAPSEFHPTLDCKGKEYHYWTCFGHAQIPQNRLYSWHYPHSLDIPKMVEASKLFIGKHDFEAFCNTRKNITYEDYIREVQMIEIIEHAEKRVQFKISGNNFLYKMVRNIVGTLMYVGRGKLQIEDIPKILNEKDRTLAGVTAAAHGLTLYKIYY